MLVMRREDFFTGEVLPSTSPPSSEFISEQEAIQNANFGMYDLDPGQRTIGIQQPIVGINPGGYGYNNMYQPMFQNVYNGFGGNPAFAYQQQMLYQQQIQQQQQIQFQYHVQPVNFSGEYLPPVDFEDRIEELKREYWMKEQAEVAKTSVDTSNNGYNPFTGYNNYYGIPYYNPYQYNNINAEINQKIQQMQDEAKDARMNLNMQLAQLAHNICGDQYNEADLRERYTGKIVDCPYNNMTYAEMVEQQRFTNLVPIDNSQYYQEHSARISNEFNKVIPTDSNMLDTFSNMGVVYAQYELEEEEHRRKNGANLYNSEDNSYKYFIRKKAAERYAKQKGLTLAQTIQQVDNLKQNMMNGFPTLAQSAKLLDDGTLNITCNFGSHAGQTYSVHNSQEAGYDQNRERFQQFLESIPGSIYLDSPNPTS